MFLQTLNRINFNPKYNSILRYKLLVIVKLFSDQMLSLVFWQTHKGLPTFPRMTFSHHQWQAVNVCLIGIKLSIVWKYKWFGNVIIPMQVATNSSWEGQWRHINRAYESCYESCVCIVLRSVEASVRGEISCSASSAVNFSRWLLKFSTKMPLNIVCTGLTPNIPTFSVEVLVSSHYTAW